MKIAVCCESTSDLPKELLAKYDIKVIPYNIILGDTEYKDGEISTAEMLEFAEKNKILPKTTAINQFEYGEFFESILKDYDAFVHICLSSGITSSFNNAISASKNFESGYVVDSKSLSTGSALLCIYARELADAGFDAKTIAEKVQKRAEDVSTSFVIDKLDFLYKGGRCSSLQLVGGSLFNIHPKCAVINGKITVDKKYRGSMEFVVSKYASELFADVSKIDKKRVFIVYPSATEAMIAQAVSACEKVGFEEIIKTTAGVTIASHCGANTLGIMFLKNENL